MTERRERLRQERQERIASGKGLSRKDAPEVSASLDLEGVGRLRLDTSTAKALADALFPAEALEELAREAAAAEVVRLLGDRIPGLGR